MDDVFGGTDRKYWSVCGSTDARTEEAYNVTSQLGRKSVGSSERASLQCRMADFAAALVSSSCTDLRRGSTPLLGSAVARILSEAAIRFLFSSAESLRQFQQTRCHRCKHAGGVV